MLVGDVISAANKQDVVTQMDEVPSFAFDDGPSLVCSCDDIHQCCKSATLKLKHQSQLLIKKVINKSQTMTHAKKNEFNDKYNHFTILRRPTRISHLSNQFDKSDYILPNQINKVDLEIKKLALESDFITYKRVERRRSF